jgi:hypothetical protein
MRCHQRDRTNTGRLCASQFQPSSLWHVPLVVTPPMGYRFKDFVRNSTMTMINHSVSRVTLACALRYLPKLTQMNYSGLTTKDSERTRGAG